MQTMFGAALAALLSAEPERRAPTFEADVRPILKAACFPCHGEESDKRGKLDARLVRLLLKGGENGPAIVPGHPESSPLWKRVAADEMPEGPKKLGEAQKETLRRWIVAGAKTARPEPADPSAARFTPEELSHWAFQPPKSPTVPTPKSAALRGRGPIDAFLGAELERRGMAFNPEADRPAQLRRLSFDLIGLPPTPEEVDVFLKDARPDAYERQVDRLLASPRHGERWARHWLDVAGYADTDGAPGEDRSRPEAFRYRDYVIRSLNADKPYDRFLTEQLAGDELVPRPFDLSKPEVVEKLTATGFLLLATDATQIDNSLTARNDAAAEALKVTASAMLGVTVGYAQCHDHRYDPITQEDYYRLRAVFDPARDIDHWRQPSQRLLDATPAATIKRIDAIEAEAVKRDKLLEAMKEKFGKSVQDREVAKLPEKDRVAARAAAETDEGKRTPEQKKYLLDHPNIKPVSFVKNFLVEYDKPYYAKVEEERKAIVKLRESKPSRDLILAVSEPEGHRPKSALHKRGDPGARGLGVGPAEPFAIAQQRPDAGLPTRPQGTTGRRLALAKRLTDGKHPLTARVFVNRVWMHHFGRGLVATPGEFGHNGERPTHPELLDWLATDFAANGWRIKRLHRMIVTSAAYRQSSRRTAAHRDDPDNRWLARQNLRRLDAEALRDALLAATGKLDATAFGPPVPLTTDGEGRPVLAKRKYNEGLFAGLEPVGDGAFRRSVYLESRRALRLPMLESFDMPAMAPNCEARSASTVAPQALLMLNDAEVFAASERIAERLWKEAPDAPARVRRLHALLFAAVPTAEESADALSFLAAQSTQFRTGGDKAWRDHVKKWPHAPDMQALAALAQTLLASNRFLYVD